MRFTPIVSALLGLAACVWADNITVKVASGGALTFSPDSVTAKQGDIIAFQFIAGNHSVTQSSFDDPCTRLTDGVDSGYQPVSTNASSVPEWSFTVDNATAPLWFYCKQGPHCKLGMVFAVNPSVNKTFDAFKAKATGGSNSSSTVPSSTGASPSPSASSNSSPNGFGTPKLAGIITLVAILVGSFF